MWPCAAGCARRAARRASPKPVRLNLLTALDKMVIDNARRDRQDGKGHYYMFTHAKTGLNVSFYIEPAERCATAGIRRDNYWRNRSPVLADVHSLTGLPLQALEVAASGSRCVRPRLAGEAVRLRTSSPGRPNSPAIALLLRTILATGCTLKGGVPAAGEVDCSRRRTDDPRRPVRLLATIEAAGSSHPPQPGQLVDLS